MPKCTICSIEKDLGNFYLKDNGKSRADCKDCHSARMLRYREKNQEKIKKVKKRHYALNNERIIAQVNNYYVNNKSVIHFKHAERYRSDALHALKLCLRNRLNIAIKKQYKSGSAVRDLGCSIEELKLYLESKFQEGMTWDNHGVYGWHIDHIVALSRFDLTNRKELLKAVHYSNLQPLWAKDNIRKGNK